MRTRVISELQQNRRTSLRNVPTCTTKANPPLVLEDKDSSIPFLSKEVKIKEPPGKTNFMAKFS